MLAVSKYCSCVIFLVGCLNNSYLQAELHPLNDAELSVISGQGPLTLKDSTAETIDQQNFIESLQNAYQLFEQYSPLQAEQITLEGMEIGAGFSASVNTDGSMSINMPSRIYIREVALQNLHPAGLLNPSLGSLVLSGVLMSNQ